MPRRCGKVDRYQGIIKSRKKTRMAENIRHANRDVRYTVVDSVVKHNHSPSSDSHPCTESVRDKRRFNRVRIYKVHKKDQRVAESGGRTRTDRPSEHGAPPRTAGR
eukprot:2262030-Amphidinium_carterae.1